MKNLLLVTIQDYKNIGNRLQNYALQTVLEKMNARVSNLTVDPVAISIKRKLKSEVKHGLGIIGFEKYLRAYAQFSRIKKCVEFTQNRIKDIKILDRKVINSSSYENYDAAITGSDQVWHNWGRIKDELEYFYLEFIEPDKRISYAPSFGFPDFPKGDIEKHHIGLMGMKALSCREQEGCKLIKDLTGRDAIKVLDPTLLLSREDWEKIEKSPDFSVPDDYLLMFFLGEITEDYYSEIERIKTSNGLKVLNINDLNDPKHYAVSPDQFIWLIHNAKVICTDSFHASVFSIIFNSDLRVFERTGKYEHMFGRLHDLLEPLGLMDVVFGHGDGTKLSTVLSKEAAEYLEMERASSLEYLHNALNSSKKEEK